MSDRIPFTRLAARTVVVNRDDIDTDQIIPARFLKTTDKSNLAAALFADWRYADGGSARADFPLNAPDAAGAEILVGGRNFGCGSSREHAVWAIAAGGFRAVIAPSFADIFRNNAAKNGLLAVAVEPEVHAAILAARATHASLVVTIDLELGLGADGVAQIEIHALDAEEEVELELVGAGDALRAAKAGDAGGVGEGARADGENVSHRWRVRPGRGGREWRRSVGAEANGRQCPRGGGRWRRLRGG